MTSSRTFTVVRVATRSHQKGKQNTGGRFHGTPLAAAKKAASRICRKSNIFGRCALDIVIQETTPGRPGKLFAYHVLRKKKTEGDAVQHGDMTVHHRYEVHARALPDPHTILAAKTPGAPKKPHRRSSSLQPIALPAIAQPTPLIVAQSGSSSSSRGQPQPAVPPFTQQQALFVGQTPSKKQVVAQQKQIALNQAPIPFLQQQMPPQTPRQSRPPQKLSFTQLLESLSQNTPQTRQTVSQQKKQQSSQTQTIPSSVSASLPRQTKQQRQSQSPLITTSPIQQKKQGQQKVSSGSGFWNFFSGGK